MPGAHRLGRPAATGSAGPRPAPLLAVLSGGAVSLVGNGTVKRVGAVPVAGHSGPLQVEAMQFSANGKYLAFEEAQGIGGAVVWVVTATGRHVVWPFRDYTYGAGWSVNASGVTSLEPPQARGESATLTSYGLSGAVSSRAIAGVPTSLAADGYTGGFVVGPDSASGVALTRVSTAGAVSKLATLPMPPKGGPPYEVTAISPDGKVFAAELGDHTDGCGVGPPSRIFLLDTATRAVHEALLPVGPNWRVMSFVFEPNDTVDATLVDCTATSAGAPMPLTTFAISSAGKVLMKATGALIATRAADDLAYEPGEVATGGGAKHVVPVMDLQPTGPLVVNGKAIPISGATVAEWAP
jgi:hypothetical protein